VKNALIRAVRTYAQVLIGLLIVNWVDVGSFSDAVRIWQIALVASVPAGLALLQNILEDNTSANIPKG
jgi:hypothetical protein